MTSRWHINPWSTLYPLNRHNRMETTSAEESPYTASHPMYIQERCIIAVLQ